MASVDIPARREAKGGNAVGMKSEIIGEPTQETRFLPYSADSSLVGRIDGYMCEKCTAKYGTAVNYSNCPFCRRKIVEYVRARKEGTHENK